MNNLIYWIDKSFVQETAQAKIGRILSEEELIQLTKMVEFGLWDAVNIQLTPAIDEVNQDN